VHESGSAGRALGDARGISRPLEALGNGEEPDRLGTVLALVVGELARPWTKQKRKREPSSRRGAALQPTGEESRWKP
jgi:hypothetical protein